MCLSIRLWKSILEFTTSGSFPFFISLCFSIDFILSSVYTIYSTLPNISYLILHTPYSSRNQCFYGGVGPRITHTNTQFIEPRQNTLKSSPNSKWDKLYGMYFRVWALLRFQLPKKDVWCGRMIWIHTVFNIWIQTQSWTRVCVFLWCCFLFLLCFDGVQQTLFIWLRYDSVEERVKSFHLDGRKFLSVMLTHAGLLKQRECDEMKNEKMLNEKMQKQQIPMPHHIVMNLPSHAIELLDLFSSLDFPVVHSGSSIPSFPTTCLPNENQCATDSLSTHQIRIHCYCFRRSDNKEEILAQASKIFSNDLLDSKYRTRIRIVRDISPRKHLICLEFDLNSNLRKIVENNQISVEGEKETVVKRDREDKMKRDGKSQQVERVGAEEEDGISLKKRRK